MTDRDVIRAALNLGLPATLLFPDIESIRARGLFGFWAVSALKEVMPVAQFLWDVLAGFLAAGLAG